MLRRQASTLALLLLGLTVSSARPDELKTVVIGTSVKESKVPPILALGLVGPHAVTAVDVSADGKRFAVATLSHLPDINYWLGSTEGRLLWGHYVQPWAPYQVALTGKAGAGAVSLAYSRITAPHPTLAIVRDVNTPDNVQTDIAGEFGWLRYGSGDWRTGWLVSALGDQVVKIGGAVFTIPTNNGALEVNDDASTRKLPAAFASYRPYRLTASGDGRVIASSCIVPDFRKLEKGKIPESLRAKASSQLLQLCGADGKVLGSVKPADEAVAIPALPDPAKEFPELAKDFALRPDALLPFRVAVAVAVNSDGSRCAFTEYAGWLWVRAGPAIGTWDPPYHITPFVPRQRGILHIVDGAGVEVTRAPLPSEGLFDVRLDGRGQTVWCSPQSWFARGMAGAGWLPTDADARTLFNYDIAGKRWKLAVQFPDAVSDVILPPAGDRLWVSCWDGNVYDVSAAGQFQASHALDGPARLCWSEAGRCLVGGTATGELFCLAVNGKQRWRFPLGQTNPLTPLPKPIERVFEDVPIYQVSRVGIEHAYVGDTWLIKTERAGLLVDTGGTSGIRFTLQRIESAGVDVKSIKYLLHTHSHGDHCGAGYLWRSMGMQVVAPESADLALAWLMPMLSDYGVWVPRPVDRPLPLKRVGDETEITLDGLKIKAIFVPGHSFDSVIYAMELDGQRIVFTGDIGFDNQDILHRCWGDVAKARAVTDVVRSKVLPFKPDFVFRGHGAKRDGTAWLEDLVKRSDEAIRKTEAEKK